MRVTRPAALSRLFHQALRTGKKARAGTHLARYAVSVSSTAIDLLRLHVPEFSACRALVIGAGEAGRLAAAALRDRGLQRFTVTSPSAARAQDLAAQLGGQVAAFDNLAGALAGADLVISCTAAPTTVVSAGMLRHAVARRGAPIVPIPGYGAAEPAPR